MSEAETNGRAIEGRSSDSGSPWWTAGTIAAALLLILVIVMQRATVLSQVAFLWTDDDQVVLWQSARDLSQGIIREPRFYGQSYNTWIEALFAVPLLWGGLSYATALPLVTTLLAMVPFLLLALFAFREGRRGAGLLVLAIPCVLTPEYMMITSMPRGFVPGLAVAALGAQLLQWGLKRAPAQGLERAERRSPWRVGAGFFLLTIALSVNPNALPLSLLVGSAALFGLDRQVRWAALGVLFALIVHAFVQRFYWMNPDYVAHRPLSFDFSFEQLLGGLTNPAPLFSIFSVGGLPAWSALLLPVFALVSVGMRASGPQRLALVLSFVVILGAMGLDKAIDGSAHSVYQPLGRVFLSLPLLCAVAVVWGEKVIPRRANMYIAAVVSLIATISLSREVSGEAARALVSKAAAPESQVQATTVARLTEFCSRVAETAQVHAVEVIIFDPSFLNAMPAYACELLVHEFPATLFPRLERRTWRLHEEMTINRERVLLVETRLKKRRSPLVGLREASVLSQHPLLILAHIEPQPVVRFLVRNRFPVRTVRRKPFRQWKREGALPAELTGSGGMPATLGP